MELEDTFVMVQTYLYNNIKYYDPNKPLHTFLHVCIKRYVNTLSEKRYKELVTMEIIKNNKEVYNNCTLLGVLFSADWSSPCQLFYKDLIDIGYI